MRKVATKLLIIVAAVYLLVLTILFVFQARFIYPAPQTQSALPQSFEEVMIDTSDGLSLRSFYRKAALDEPTLVYFHGNSGTLTGAKVATQPLAEAGIGLLLVEYRGYAGHAGGPGEEGFYVDGDAAMAWLLAKGIARELTIIRGNSLGTGVATEMALRHQPAALILTAPFTSMPDVAANSLPIFPVRLLMHDRFDNAAKLPKLTMPILIQHGTMDEVVPFELGLALSQTNPAVEFQRFEGAGHGLAFERGSGEARAEWIRGLGLNRAR
ncbi:hypothetical protein EH31_15800 [Erythrobacter longus]|uniref:Alpha/beta hydrolase n=1 Tax=Erythrobacter longus TaxID=1044 RepID=A0A074M697_ERYLO|nr:alpha/beta hydrolase [Erythrobacter longus]KEO88894.1 hypothetical protein EH31_15800 [Erythrobacter longus]